MNGGVNFHSTGVLEGQGLKWPPPPLHANRSGRRADPTYLSLHDWGLGQRRTVWLPRNQGNDDLVGYARDERLIGDGSECLV